MSAVSSPKSAGSSASSATVMPSPPSPLMSSFEVRPADERMKEIIFQALKTPLSLSSSIPDLVTFCERNWAVIDLANGSKRVETFRQNIRSFIKEYPEFGRFYAVLFDNSEDVSPEAEVSDESITYREYLVAKTLKVVQSNLGIIFPEELCDALNKLCMKDEVSRMSLCYFSASPDVFYREKWPTPPLLNSLFYKYKIYREFAQRNDFCPSFYSSLFEAMQYSDASLLSSLQSTPHQFSVAYQVLHKLNISLALRVPFLIQLVQMDEQVLEGLPVWLNQMREEPFIHYSENSTYNLFKLTRTRADLERWEGNLKSFGKAMSVYFKFEKETPDYFPVLMLPPPNYSILFKPLHIEKGSSYSHEYTQLIIQFTEGKITPRHAKALEAFEGRRGVVLSASVWTEVFSEEVPLSPEDIPDSLIDEVLAYLPNEGPLSYQIQLFFALLQMKAKKETFDKMMETIQALHILLGYPIGKKQILTFFQYPPSQNASESLSGLVQTLVSFRTCLVGEFLHELLLPAEFYRKVKKVLALLEHTFPIQSRSIYLQVEAAVFPCRAASFAEYLQVVVKKDTRRRGHYYLELVTPHINAIHSSPLPSLSFIPRWNVPCLMPKIEEVTSPSSQSRRRGFQRLSISTMPKADSLQFLSFQVQFFDPTTFETNSLQVPIDMSLSALKKEPRFFTILSKLVTYLGDEDTCLEVAPPDRDLPESDQCLYYINQSDDLKALWKALMEERANRELEATILSALFSFVKTLKINLRKAFYNIPLTPPHSSTHTWQNEELAARGKIRAVENGIHLLPCQIEENESCFTLTELTPEISQSIWEKLKDVQTTEKIPRLPFQIDVLYLYETKKLPLSLTFYPESKSLSLLYEDNLESELEIRYGERFNEEDFHSFFRFHLLLLKMHYYQRSIQQLKAATGNASPASSRTNTPLISAHHRRAVSSAYLDGSHQVFLQGQ